MSHSTFKLLFFKQDNCPPCYRAAEALARALDRDDNRSKYHQYIEVCPRDSSKDLIEQYRVDLYPTVLIVKDGEIYKKVVGGNNLAFPTLWENLFELVHGLETGL